ncbi:MAG TPA: hypothetical protein VEY13_09975 [Rubrobacteraceae bacterium]|nr:hypothetical protein [Rubrobacteraceae bacterium]
MTRASPGAPLAIDRWMGGILAGIVYGSTAAPIESPRATIPAKDAAVSVQA